MTPEGSAESLYGKEFLITLSQNFISLGSGKKVTDEGPVKDTSAKVQWQPSKSGRLRRFDEFAVFAPYLGRLQASALGNFGLDEPGPCVGIAVLDKG